MTEIDYSRFELDELYEALNSIDKDEYPGNYRRLVAEIERKKKITPIPQSKTTDFFSRKISPSSYVIMVAFYAITILEYTRGYIFMWSRTQRLYLRNGNATTAFIGITLMVVAQTIYWLIQAEKLKKTSTNKNWFWIISGLGVGLLTLGIFRQLFS